MLARSVSVLLTDNSLGWMVFLCACTLVTALTSRKNRPLILGTLGHTVVLTAVTLETDEFSGRWHIVEAAVRDPWPGRGARTLSGEEWHDARFAARVLLHGI